MPVDLNTLTSKQKKVYFAIESFIKQKGIPPTVREIGEMVGDRTPGAVQGILNRLEQKGVIKRELGMARSIQLVTNDSQFMPAVYIPEVKKVTKRNINDLLSIYNISCYHPISPYIVHSSEGCFITNYYNDIVPDSGLGPDDMLIISRCAEISDTDLVLVLYENHVLLRQYNVNENPDMLMLKAESSLYGKQLFNKSEVMIIGRLVGRFTKY